MRNIILLASVVLLCSTWISASAHALIDPFSQFDPSALDGNELGTHLGEADQFAQLVSALEAFFGNDAPYDVSANSSDNDSNSFEDELEEHAIVVAAPQTQALVATEAVSQRVNRRKPKQTPSGGLERPPRA